MYKHILAALDHSPRAAEVLHHAAQLATHTGATLHVCRAVTIPIGGVPTDAWMLTGVELTGRLLDYGRAELDALIHAMPTPQHPIVWGQRVCRLGSPGRVVVELADELHAELIVVGSHGYDILDRFLGTTAAWIVNHAHCSVLVARAPSAPSP